MKLDSMRNFRLIDSVSNIVQSITSEAISPVGFMLWKMLLKKSDWIFFQEVLRLRFFFQSIKPFSKSVLINI